MSDQELNLTRKLFAVVEGLVKETKVYDIDVDLESEFSTVSEADFSFEIDTGELACDIPADISGAPVTIPCETLEILQQFNHPQVVDVSMEAIDPGVRDEEVESIRFAEVHNLDDAIFSGLDHSTPVHDLFKQFDLKSKLFYTTTVKAVNIEKLSLKTKDIPLKINAAVKENLYFFRRLTVERDSAELSLLPEKEQLLFWKKAVAKTRKEPKYLKLIAVYTAVPYAYIETEKITMNPALETLSYHFKSKIPGHRGDDGFKDVALFTLLSADSAAAKDTKKSSLVMVKK